MAGKSHKPEYWGSPLDEERKAAARVLGVLGRMCGLMGLAGPDWEESGAVWCAEEERRRRESKGPEVPSSKLQEFQVEAAAEEIPESGQENDDDDA